MTVYFVRRLNDASQIKIGTSNDLADRLRRLAADFGDIVLFAQCEGGVETERLYQKAFSNLRVEGEWFRAETDLIDFIGENASSVELIVPRRSDEWKRRAVSGENRDLASAATIMKLYFERFPPTMTMADARENLFTELASINPIWTRRRVRALWEGDARRVDMFEIVDLLVAAGVPRSGWADVISPPVVRSAVSS
jgi:hypothetical protein